MIPFGQPILVGHHSEKRHRRDIERIDGGIRRSIESSQMAESMASRAESIRAQAETAIYSDDADAIERLEEKLADMIAERERYKTENAAWRKANREAIKGMSAWERDNAQPHRSYKGTNLSGNISRTKARIEQLKREKVQGPRDRMITARRGGSCEDCGAVITPGDTIRYNRQQGARCATCPTESEQS